MNKYIIMLLLLFVIGAFLGGCLFMAIGKHSSSKSYRIALFARKGLSYERVIKGFMQGVHQDAENSYQVDTYYADAGDKITSTAVIEEAISRKSDILVPIGVMYAQLAKVATEKRKKLIPIVFSGAANPVESGLVRSTNKTGNHLTGINNLPDNPLRPAKVLWMLYPTVSSILIPYEINCSAGDDLEKIAKQSASFLRNKGVRVVLLPIDNVADLLSRVKSFIHDIDVVMTLEGGLAFAVTDGLIKLCKQHGKAFFANELDAVKKGAPFGFAADFSIAGMHTFKYVRKILVDGIRPSLLPVKYITEGRRIAINTQALSLLNLDLPEDIELCLQRGTVFKEIEESFLD